MPPPSSKIERKERRKAEGRQTRLMFDALPSGSSDLEGGSSPAQAQKNVGKSPARIKYEVPSGPSPMSSREGIAEVITPGRQTDRARGRGRGRGRGKMMAKRGGGRSGSLFGGGRGMPTPGKSSQVDASQIAGGRGRVRRGGDSLDLSDDEDDLGKGFSSATRRSTRVTSSTGNPFYTATSGIANDSDSSAGSPPEDEEDLTPSKIISHTKRNTESSSKSKPLKSVTLSNSEETTPPRSGNQQPILLDDSEDELASLPRPIRGRKAGNLIIPTKENGDEDEDDDSEPPVASSAVRSRRSIIVDDDSDELPKNSRGSKLKNKEFVELDSESEDEEPVVSPLKRRKPLVGSESSDVISSPMKRRKQAIDESDENSDLPSLTKLTSSSSRAKQSKSPTTPSRITRLSKPKRHRTEKEKAAELLRRKRAGEKIDELTESSSDSEEEEERGLYDSDSDLKALSEFEDESEVEEVEIRPKKEKPKPRVRRSNVSEDEDHYDSEFVDDDEEGLIGVPSASLHDIPLQFTHQAHKKLEEHFRDCVEWLIHNKLDPAFPHRNDDIYKHAFIKVNDEAQGLANSKFISPQWTDEFTKALRARPEFRTRGVRDGEGLDVDGVPKCDACNHRNHPPSEALRFVGKAYDKKTLLEVEQDSDDSEDEEEREGEPVEVNEDGYEIAPETKEFFSGRDCAAKAYHAHALTHWKFALNSWILDSLATEGYLSPEALAEREAMSAKRRRKYANAVVDRWDKDRSIHGLYGVFKKVLSEARGYVGGRYAGGRRRG